MLPLQRIYCKKNGFWLWWKKSFWIVLRLSRIQHHWEARWLIKRCQYLKLSHYLLTDNFWIIIQFSRIQYHFEVKLIKRCQQLKLSHYLLPDNLWTVLLVFCSQMLIKAINFLSVSSYVRVMSEFINLWEIYIFHGSWKKKWFLIGVVSYFIIKALQS